ncbi:MAG TPA: adenosylmethionine--8-amino-7-oxononanoate transaminase [Caulobacterales bacterium]|nr:adenosylmethionine--8-amino-7-oxononanoate transaminase [Caulobacterales bacterium]
MDDRKSPPRWLEHGARHVWRPYAQMKTAPAPLPVVRTEGVRLHLADGRVLLDGVASWWTACHGYNHPHIIAAMRAQLEIMPHVMLGGLAHEQAYRLAARLAALLPGDLDHVFFAESGSVAVEIAMKMAVQYHLNRGARGRTKFVSFRGGYHGDTIATMSVCDPDEGMHALFAGALPEQHIADLPRDENGEAALDALLARHDDVAAILVEPLVQGAGGMLFHDAEVLRRLRRLADAHGVLLIFDEIFTGFGRTGTLFAMQQAGVEPDIVTLSKALTGGAAPLSAAIASKRVFEAFLNDDPMHALMHGPTYMGHALGCAAANASLDIFDRNAWQADVARIAARLEEGLAPCLGLPGVADVRVKGAIGVVELEKAPDIGALTRRFVEQGVWIRPFNKIVYLTPAFVTTDDELAQLTRAIHVALSR